MSNENNKNDSLLKVGQKPSYGELDGTLVDLVQKRYMAVKSGANVKNNKKSLSAQNRARGFVFGTSAVLVVGFVGATHLYKDYAFDKAQTAFEEYLDDSSSLLSKIPSSYIENQDYTQLRTDEKLVLFQETLKEALDNPNNVSTEELYNLLVEGNSLICDSIQEKVYDAYIEYLDSKDTTDYSFVNREIQDILTSPSKIDILYGNTNNLNYRVAVLSKSGKYLDLSTKMDDILSDTVESYLKLKELTGDIYTVISEEENCSKAKIKECLTSLTNGFVEASKLYDYNFKIEEEKNLLGSTITVINAYEMNYPDKKQYYEQYYGKDTLSTPVDALERGVPLSDDYSVEYIEFQDDEER